MKRKTNYYLRVVKVKQGYARNPIFVNWAKRKRLTKKQIDQALESMLIR